MSGLGSGKSVVLQNNGGNNQTVTNPATTFAFPAQNNGTAYNVTVLTQPVGQTCLVTNGTGTLAGANVTNVLVTCTNTTYTVGGSISGLSAAGLTLTLSGAQSDTNSPLSGDLSYTFSKTLVTGNSYTVVISAQPAGQTCTQSGDPLTGTVGTSNIVVDVSCTVNAYTIAVTNTSAAAVTITGSTATNATNPNSATSFNFSAKHGDNVSLSATKTGSTCSVATTPVSINPITGNATVIVSCDPLRVGGVINGLNSGNTIRLKKTIGSDAPSGAAVSFGAASDPPAELPGAGNYGWSFSLVGSQKVSALGLYNNDFNSDIQVGLWGSNGGLLASGVFSSTGIGGCAPTIVTALAKTTNFIL